MTTMIQRTAAPRRSAILATTWHGECTGVLLVHVRITSCPRGGLGMVVASPASCSGGGRGSVSKRRSLACATLSVGWLVGLLGAPGAAWTPQGGERGTGASSKSSMAVTCSALMAVDGGGPN